MTERQLVEEAFATLVKQLFVVFNQNYSSAAGDPGSEQRAETIFHNGILHARHVRDRALANLPP